VGTGGYQRRPRESSNEQRQPKKQGHGFRNFFLVCFGIGVLLVIVGAAVGGGSSSNSSSSSVAPPPSKDQATAIDPRRLVGDPNSFKGQNIVLQGEALNVEEHSDYTWIDLQAGVPGRDATETIVVETHPKNSNVLAQDCYRFYGVAAGTTTMKLLLTGVTNDVPLVNAYAVESAPQGDYGIGCAPPQETAAGWTAAQAQAWETSCGVVDNLCRCELDIMEKEAAFSDFNPQTFAAVTAAGNKADGDAVDTCRER